MSFVYIYLSCDNGALVQLVRMPACHAGGHGFESRMYRLRPSITGNGSSLALGEWNDH